MVPAFRSSTDVNYAERSLPGIVGARELFKSGVLGKLSRIEECRNSAQPYWYNYLKDVKADDVDWREFLHSAAVQAGTVAPPASRV